MKKNDQLTQEFSDLNSMRASDTVRVDELNEEVRILHYENLVLKDEKRKD